MEHLKSFAIATAAVIVGIAVYNNVLKTMVTTLK